MRICENKADLDEKKKVLLCTRVGEAWVVYFLKVTDL